MAFTWAAYIASVRLETRGTDLNFKLSPPDILCKTVLFLCGRRTCQPARRTKYKILVVPSKKREKKEGCD